MQSCALGKTCIEIQLKNINKSYSVKLSFFLHKNFNITKRQSKFVQ